MNLPAVPYLAVPAWRRAEDWLTAPRARIYARILLAAGLFLTVACYAEILRPALTGPAHRPLGSDFDTFWAGAWLALHGHAAAAYAPDAIKAAEAVGAQVPGNQLYVYLYPPTFLALSLPLAWLPYLAALPLFLAASYALMFAPLRRILPPAWPAIAILAFPAAMLNAVIGQNGCLSAGCFGGAAWLLERRPALAGMCLGLLVYKPHLAIGAPFVLAAARRWTALAACALTAAGLIVFSWAMLGTGTWRAFLATVPLIRAMLQSTDVWPKMMSAYAAARLLGAGPYFAAALQVGVALGALVCVLMVGARRPGAGAEIAVIVAAAMLCSPYVWDYDQVCLAVPMAWVAAEGGRLGWRSGERTILAALYLLPVLARALNLAIGLPIAPLLLLALLAAITMRARPTPSVTEA